MFAGGQDLLCSELIARATSGLSIDLKRLDATCAIVWEGRGIGRCSPLKQGRVPAQHCLYS